MSDKVKQAEANYLEARMAHMRAREAAHSARHKLVDALCDHGEEEYKLKGLWPWDKLLAIYPDGSHEYLFYRGFVQFQDRLVVRPRFVKLTPATNRPSTKEVVIPPGTELVPIIRCAKDGR